MKLSTHLIIQAIAMLVQAGNEYSSVIPDKYKPAVALVVGLGQAAVAWYNHNYNPDGTPAQVAYVKK